MAKIMKDLEQEQALLEVTELLQQLKVLDGSLKNEEDGKLTNKGENSHITGDVENDGDMSNEGSIDGKVDKVI